MTSFFYDIIHLQIKDLCVPLDGHF